MLTLTSDQDALLGAEAKRVSWLFTVTVDSVVYEWSTKNYSFGGNSYENRVIPASFNGVELNRSMSEYGIQAPSQLLFEVSNDDGSLFVSDFAGCDVQLDLVLSDWSDEQIISSWRFTVLSVTELQGTLRFTCEDFLSKYLVGDYPNTTLISQLAPDPSLPNDNLCVPVPFGTVYAPVRSVYIVDQRYYLLGPATHTYTLTEIQSPEDWGSTSIWEEDSIHDFNQYSKTLDGTSYRVFQPIIADSNEDGTPDASGLWTQGGKFLDPYVKFSRDDLVGVTNPADILEYLLEDFGVDSADIDTGVGSSFATAEATYTSWGLELNGAFFYKMSRQEALSLILLSCNSTLRITDKLELHVLSKTSQMTIDSSIVLKQGTLGETTFEHQSSIGEESDYGFVAYVPTGEPQGRMVKLKAAAKGTYLVSSGDTLELPLMNDGQDAVRAGSLYFQRLLGDDGQLSFQGVDECLVLQPEDVITIDEVDYGGGEVDDETGASWGPTVHGLSFADGYAFIGVSGLDLSPYAGTEGSDTPYQLVLHDSAAKVAQGYIGAADAGETLGTELVVGGTFTAWTGDNPDGWFIHVAETGGHYVTEVTGKARIVDDGVAEGIYQVINMTPGKLYKLSFNIVTATSGSIIAIMRGPGGWGDYAYYGTYSTTGIKTIYFTAAATHTQITAMFLGNAGCDIIIDDVELKEVTHTAATGVHIVSAKDGSTRNWASIESGFNYNDTAYTLEVTSRYSAIVDSVRIERDLTINVSAIKNRFALDDWEDLSPAAVTVADDDSSSAWTPVISGPSSEDYSGGTAPNLVHGVLRVGAGPDCILIDSNSTLITINEGGVVRIALGELGSQGFGITGRDASNNIIFNIDADSALIAGWSFDSTKLYTANIIIDSANQRIRSSNYVAGPDGAGFTVQSDLVEAGDIRARGVLQTVVFRKDCISALSGDLLIVKNADVLDADMTALDAATMTITGAVSFVANDKLRLKNVTDEEWITVVSAAGAPTYTLTRDRGTDYGPNANPAWKKGTAVVNYGQTSDYGILITAHQTNNPYLSFFQVPSSPWTTALTEIVRIGQLNGFAGYSTSAFGFAVYYSATNYVKVDATYGIRMSVSYSGGITIASGGGITVSSGGGITISSGGSLTVNGGGGITVYDGANITILAGGDLIVQAGVSTDAVISITDSSGVARLNLTYFPDVVYSSINPGISSDTYNLTIGQVSFKWHYVYMFAGSGCKFYAYYNSSYNSIIECNASSTNTYITFNTGSGDESLYIDHAGNVEISRGDLYLEYGEIFIKASGTTEGKIYAMTDTLYIVPPSDGASSAYIGSSGYRFTDVHIFGSTQALLRWYTDASNQSYFQVASPRCRMYTIGSGSYVDAYTEGTLRWKVDGSGDMYLYGGSIVIPASEYVNFGGTLGTGGYGFRDNGGQMEMKDSGGSWTDISGLSDARAKRQVEDSVLGLDFVLRLRPRQFLWADDEKNRLDADGKTPVPQQGIVAQELRAVLDELGTSFGGWHELADDGRTQKLDYHQFIPVLINAIKELKAQMEGVKLLKNL